MPTVPLYRPNQVREQLGPQQRINTNAPIESFEGGAGVDKVVSATQGLVGQAEKLFAQERLNADKLRVADAENTLMDSRQALFWGRTDPRDPSKNVEGVISKKGKDAFGAPQEYMEKYEAEIAKIEASLGNDNQKFLLRQKAEEQKLSFKDQLFRHTVAEAEQYDKGVTEAKLQLALKDAGLNYNDPLLVEKSIQKQKEEIQRLAERNGYGPEVMQIMTEKAVSRTRVTVLDQLMSSGQDKLAGEYFKLHEKELLPDEQLKMREAIESNSILGESQRLTDEYMSKYSTMTSALNAAASIEEPKLRKATEERIERGFRLQKEAKEQTSDILYDRAYTALEQTGGDVDKYMRENQRTWLAMKPEDKDKLKRQAKQIQEGRDPETDVNTYFDLMIMASDPATQNNFLKENVNRYSDKLSKSDKKKIIDTRADMLKGDMRAVEDFRTQREIVSGTMKAAGLKTDSKNKKDQQRINTFQTKLNQEVKNFYEINKKKPSDDQLQSMADKLLLKAKVQGTGIFGFGKNEKPLYDFAPGEIPEIEAEDIPKNDMIKIEQAFKLKGKPFNEAEAVRMYKKKNGIK